MMAYTCYPSYMGGIGRKKITKLKGAWDLAQVVEWMPNKCEALSSNSNAKKKKKKRRKRRRKRKL
jgi:hypothetical protein